jgi:hypothetical protein
MNQYFYLKLPSQVQSILFIERPEGSSPASLRADLIFHLLCCKSAILKCKIQTWYIDPWNLINESIFLLETALSRTEHIIFRAPWRVFTKQFKGWFEFSSTLQQVCYIELQNPDAVHWALKYDQIVNIFTWNLPSHVQSLLFFERPEGSSPASFWADLNFHLLCCKSAILKCKIQTPYIEPWNLINDSIFLLELALLGIKHIIYKAPWRVFTSQF